MYICAHVFSLFFLFPLFLSILFLSGFPLRSRFLFDTLCLDFCWCSTSLIVGKRIVLGADHCNFKANDQNIFVLFLTCHFFFSLSISLSLVCKQ